LAIVVHHTWLYAGGAERRLGEGTRVAFAFNNLALGVTLFFALSGFLLYRPIVLAVMRGTPMPSTRAYLRNRALRILPAYWVILVLASVGLATTYAGWAGRELLQGSVTDPGDLLAALLFVQNYHPSTLLVGIGPAWSLSVEVVFYLALPVLGLLAARIAGTAPTLRRRLVAVLTPPSLLLAIGLAGKFAAWTVVGGTPQSGFLPTWHAVLERSFLAQADLFAFGMTAAVVHVLHVDGTAVVTRYRRAAAAAAMVVIAVPCAATLRGAELSYLPQNTVLALAAGLLLVVVIVPEPGGEPSAIARMLDARPLAAAGLISYSVFLWHEPLIRWVADRGPELPEGWVGLAVSLAIVLTVTLAAATVTYLLVERPALRRKSGGRKSGATVMNGQAQAAP
jgi:peptidoglycan/LPS O-acetylase OafA/YrhL